MLARLAIFALLPVFAVAAFLVAFFVFYRGSYDPPPSPDLRFEQINTSSVPSRVSGSLPPGQLRSGLLLVDAQHVNSFTESELVSFASMVADRGFDVEFVGDFLPLEDPEQAQPRLLQLAEKLRRADSFAVILPQTPYTETEAVLVERFVRKGGTAAAGIGPRASPEHQRSGEAVRGGLPSRLSLQHAGKPTPTSGAS